MCIGAAKRTIVLMSLKQTELGFTAMQGFPKEFRAVVLKILNAIKRFKQGADSMEFRTLPTPPPKSTPQTSKKL